MEMPLYNHLIKYHNSGRVSFAMPGHKNGRGLLKNIIDCDVTELDATEDLHEPGEVLLRSQEMISKVYGVDESLILTSGSTTGIQAMIAAVYKKGGVLLSSPDCHMSVINACALMGVQLMFAPMKYDSFGHCTGFDYEKLEDILNKEKLICAVIAVSPDYYGICKNISKTAHICHKYDIPFLVDGAHGAHFASSDIFPDFNGADCIVMSAHKTLNALTGAAYVHVNGNRVNKERLKIALGMFGSSSPSYVISASAEAAALTMDKSEWERTAKRCTELKKSISMPSLVNDDPTRMVFFTGEKTGFEVEKLLADEFGIDIEMADLHSIVLIATPSNTEDDFERLNKALSKISNTLEPEECKAILPTSEIFSPSDGFFGECESVNIDDALGRIAASTVMAYPPGIPVICCGAKITEQMIKNIKELQKAGAKLKGIDKDLMVNVY